LCQIVVIYTSKRVFREAKFAENPYFIVVHPAGFEPAASWFEVFRMRDRNKLKKVDLIGKRLKKTIKLRFSVICKVKC